MGSRPRLAGAARLAVQDRARVMGGLGGSLERPGRLLMHLHIVYVAESMCYAPPFEWRRVIGVPSHPLEPLAEQACRPRFKTAELRLARVLRQGEDADESPVARACQERGVGEDRALTEHLLKQLGLNLAFEVLTFRCGLLSTLPGKCMSFSAGSGA